MSVEYDHTWINGVEQMNPDWFHLCDTPQRFKCTESGIITNHTLFAERLKFLMLHIPTENYLVRRSLDWYGQPPVTLQNWFKHFRSPPKAKQAQKKGPSASSNHTRTHNSHGNNNVTHNIKPHLNATHIKPHSVSIPIKTQVNVTQTKTQSKAQNTQNNNSTKVVAAAVVV
jgi:hypothetical protein